MASAAPKGAASAAPEGAASAASLDAAGRKKLSAFSRSMFCLFQHVIEASSLFLFTLTYLESTRKTKYVYIYINAMFVLSREVIRKSEDGRAGTGRGGPKKLTSSRFTQFVSRESECVHVRAHEKGWV